MKPNYKLLKEAYAIIGGIPDNVIYLGTLVLQRGPSLGCGTICCAAGWLAHHPKFQALGLIPEGCYSIRHRDRPSLDYYEDIMGVVFGVSSEDAQEIFSPRGCSKYDDNSPWITDKQVWLARVRKFLGEHGQLGAQP